MSGSDAWSGLQKAGIVVLAYILCHGLTAMLVTPIQEQFLSEITVFASLVYLPHGVRVLATWLWGWKAVPPLVVGAFLSELIFTPSDVQELVQPVILESIAVGALSAVLAFEAFRLFGRPVYAGQSRRMSWRWIILAGAIASVLNSLGQSFVFSGLIFPEDTVPVLATFALGDLIGLVVAMVALMLIFRWMRTASETRG